MNPEIHAMKEQIHSLEHRIEELTYAVMDMQKQQNKLLFKEALEKAQAALPNLSLRLDLNPDQECVLRVKVITENGTRGMIAEQVTAKVDDAGIVSYEHVEAKLNVDVANLIDAAMLFNTMNYPDTWVYVTAYDTSKVVENADG